MKKIASYLRTVSLLSLFMLGSCLMVGCGEEPAPEPTQSKEERRTEQKEMMHREMNNK